MVREGPHALTVRAVADEVGVTTRGVYSSFGSKGALLAALAKRAFEFLRDELDRLPVSDNAAADLVECGAKVYRRLVLEHPALYRIAFQRVVPGLELTDELSAVRAEAFDRLVFRVGRLPSMRDQSEEAVRAAAVAFNAMCEGMANAELRGGTLRMLPAGQEERAWRDAFETIVRALA